MVNYSFRQFSILLILHISSCLPNRGKVWVLSPTDIYRKCMIWWTVSFCLQIEFLKQILLWGKQTLRFPTWCPSVQFFASENNYFKRSLVPFMMHGNRNASILESQTSSTHLKVDESSENSQIRPFLFICSISILKRFDLAFINCIWLHHVALSKDKTHIINHNDLLIF